ncbi:MAG: flagellar brake protein [Deltaproteobacteria bacterium]|nr:flagellar brake protein [Deltaproteobacteria bacterium]
MRFEETVDRERQGLALCMNHGHLLDLEVEGIPGSVTGFCVGMLQRDYIIVQVPQIPTLVHRLSQGLNVTCSYRYSNHPYQFPSEVKGFYCENNFKLLFLSYPVSIEDRDMRRKERVNCCLPALMTVDRKQHEGIIANISIDGCRFQTNAGTLTYINLDEDVSVSCYLMGLVERQELGGSIRSSIVDQKQIQLGIEFTNLDNNKVTNISRYIENIVESTPLKGNEASS